MLSIDSIVPNPRSHDDDELKKIIRTILLRFPLNLREFSRIFFGKFHRLLMIQLWHISHPNSMQCLYNVVWRRILEHFQMIDTNIPVQTHNY